MSRSRNPARYPLACDGGLTRDVPSLRREAERLTAEALDTRCPHRAARALAVRAEADLADRVGRWRRPVIDGDAGPSGPGRGAVTEGEVAVFTYSPRADRLVPTVTRVVHRPVTRTLKGLPDRERLAALAYEELVAQRGAMRIVDLEGPSGAGGVSDGGAAARWEDDALLAAVERAIGKGVALRPLRQRRHDMDRGLRRVITVRVLVDRVCLYGRSIEDVLGAYGWSRKKEHRQVLKTVLTEALGRAAGVLENGD